MSAGEAARLLRVSRADALRVRQPRLRPLAADAGTVARATVLAGRCRAAAAADRGAPRSGQGGGARAAVGTADPRVVDHVHRRQGASTTAATTRCSWRVRDRWRKWRRSSGVASSMRAFSPTPPRIAPTVPAGQDAAVRGPRAVGAGVRCRSAITRPSICARRASRMRLADSASPDRVARLSRTSGPTIDQALAHAWGVNARGVDVLRSALILCADHELNVSSFTARCVASAGSNPYAVVIAGLAALEGTRHGGASARVESMLDVAASARGTPGTPSPRGCAAASRSTASGTRFTATAIRERPRFSTLLRERYAKSRELSFVLDVADAASAITRERTESRLRPRVGGSRAAAAGRIAADALRHRQDDWVDRSGHRAVRDGTAHSAARQVRWRCARRGRCSGPGCAIEWRAKAHDGLESYTVRRHSHESGLARPPGARPSSVPRSSSSAGPGRTCRQWTTGAHPVATGAGPGALPSSASGAAARRVPARARGQLRGCRMGTRRERSRSPGRRVEHLAHRRVFVLSRCRRLRGHPNDGRRCLEATRKTATRVERGLFNGRGVVQRRG